jgi:hypothetical protein
MEGRLILVGCVKTKRPHPAPAKDLYDSALWWKRRRYAEATGMPWAILSAEHGMVDPDRILEPYDRYLGNESLAFRRRWSANTAEQVLRRLGELAISAVEIHAGSAYVSYGLKTQLENQGVAISWPVEGMRFGDHLAWYG